MAGLALLWCIRVEPHRSSCCVRIWAIRLDVRMILSCPLGIIADICTRRPVSVRQFIVYITWHRVGVGGGICFLAVKIRSVGLMSLTPLFLQLLCVIPVPILRWTLCGIAFGLSGYFLVANVYPILASVRHTLLCWFSLRFIPLEISDVEIRLVELN